MKMETKITAAHSLWDAISKDYKLDPESFEVELAREIVEIFRASGVKDSATLLEAGSGSGQLSLKLAENGYRVALLDFSTEAIEKSKQVFQQHSQKADFYHGDLLKMQTILGKTSFDVVWNSGVLEHFNFESLIKALQQMKKFSKKYVFFVVPNAESLIYQGYRLRKLESRKWDVGVEFLRSNYEDAIYQAGLSVVSTGYLGAAFTELFMQYFLADEVSNELFKTLLRKGDEFNNQFVLRYCLCAIQPAKKNLKPALADEEKTIDKTFYLDSLGSINSIIRDYAQRAKELQSERDAALAAEAKQEQVATGQEAGYEKRIAELEKRLSALQSERDAALAAEAKQEQVATGQKAGYEKRIAELEERLAALQSERDKALAAEAKYKQAAHEKILKYKNQVTALDKQSGELKTERDKAQKQLSRLETWKGEFEQELDAIKVIMRDLPAIFNRLHNLSAGRAYRLVRLMRLFRSEVLGFKPGRMLIFARKVAAYLGGARGVFTDYLQEDPLFLHLEYLNELNIKIKSFLLPVLPQLPSETASDSQPDVNKPELRRTVLHPRRTGPKRVAYYTNMLLDWADQRPRYGGGERYCLTITELLEDLGLEVDLYQVAPKPFEGEYHGHHVKALKKGEGYSEFILGAGREFYEISQQYDHVLYNMPELSAGPMRLDALSICHGIWYDHENYGAVVQYRSREWYSYLYRIFGNPRRIVSVDSNTINVIRSMWPPFAEKMQYIPNFFDPEKFYPPKKPRKNDRLKILFPRRSHVNRGSRILGDILRQIPHQVDFYWVGEGDDQDTQLLKDLQKKDNRLHFDFADFDQMPAWYRKADIAAIPTIACEGTSFSCIEALASGCAIVATNVGGLVDLVQHSVNGLLVTPDPAAIAGAINSLIENPEECRRLQIAGPKSADAFSYPRWRRKWEQVLISEGWIEPQEAALKKTRKDRAERDKPQAVIITRNAYHGGVETMVRLESLGLKTPVIVTGGLNDPGRTCPFSYTSVQTYEELLELLEEFDVVLYHWPLDWAVQAIKDSGLPCIEYIHRSDTSECDKSVPNLTLAHTDHLVEFVKDTFGVKSQLVPYPVDLDRFKPDPEVKGAAVGAITSYFDIKGVDIFIKAWAKLAAKYPEIPVVFYGAGDDLACYKQMARELGIKIDFRGPLAEPEEAYREYRVYVSAARQEGGAPLAALEALATNVPVVASDLSGCVELNRTARENGFDEPLIIFKSEDADDLAAKLDQTLQDNKTPQVRKIVEKLFNAEAHIENLDKVLESTYKTGSGREKVEWELLDDCENTGTMATMYSEGFIISSVNMGGQENIPEVLRPEGSPLVTTYSNFVCYRYVFPEETQRISCYVSCNGTAQAVLNIQFDFYTSRFEFIQSTSCFGRLVDQCNHNFYVTREAVPGAGMVEIIMRPNPGDDAEIKCIRMRAWRKTDA